VRSAVESCTPYCILELVHNRSPTDSPRASPIARRRSSKVSVSEPDEIYQTAMVKAQNGDVKWDEKFEM